MIQIEVTGNHRTVTLKDGRTFPAQEAYATIPGQKYPARVEISPPKGQALYNAGVYTLAPESIYVGRFGSLELAPKLVPVTAPKR